MKEEMTGPELRFFRFMLVFRLAATALMIAIIGGLKFTSVFPSGETVSTVNASLAFPWAFLAAIVALSVLKFCAMVCTEDSELALPFYLVFIFQFFRMLFWIAIFGYSVMGIFTDTAYWKIPAAVSAIYLVVELIYFFAMTHTDESNN